jgi:hypothetical protein
MSPAGEATAKDCGVAVARLQGHNWAPTPPKGLGVNVGTTLTVPLGSHLLTSGQARRRLMPTGWGGEPVVVRGRESRSHGEGAQCLRSSDAKRGDHR